MGLRTLQEMRDELIQRLGNRQDVAAARLNNWINAAYMEITTRYVFHELHRRELVPVAAGDDAVVLPGDIHSILSMRDMTNYKKLRPTSWRSIDDAGEYVFSSPESYARFGAVALLQPGTEADLIVQVRYLARVTPLVVDTDVAVTPTEWDEVIEQGALWRALRALLEPERAEGERQEHLRLINSMPLADQLEDIDYGRESTMGPRFAP